MNIVILGLSISSAWGNGHATTYRALVRALAERGHRVLFLERDVPWYAKHRDLPDPSFCSVRIYDDLEALDARYRGAVAEADLVMLGSFVPEGIAAGHWMARHAHGVTAFYDIDTPVTLAGLERNDCDYLNKDSIPSFDLYLSFTGGPVLQKLEQDYGAHRARALYCSFDPRNYYPEDVEKNCDLGYMGTYSVDRQPSLENLLLEPARRWPQGRFIVAGPKYPQELRWPTNVGRIEHLAPRNHRRFYNRQRFTLNVTRADMIRAGWSPSVRLFEAAACGVPVVSDYWEGLEEFFIPGEEILIAKSPDDTLRFVRALPETARRAIGTRARRRALDHHTAAHRAMALEDYVAEVVRPRGTNPASA